MTDSILEQVVPQLEANLEQTIHAQRIPGMAVGIVRDQQLAWSRGFGFADLNSSRQPDEHTLFRVASITKTLTTAAILQLRDNGLLSLDDPLSVHIPEFANAQPRAGSVDAVTLRRMLTHRSGLTTEAPLPCWDALDFPSRDAVLAAIPDIEVVIPQDSAFKYSNLAFGLLGEVVTRVSGRPYFEYTQTEILDPLGMDSSAFELTDELRTRLAIGYSANPFEDAFDPAPYALLNGVAACGQLHSTVNDLAKWISQQFRTDDERSGAQVLQGATIEESHRPQYVEPDWSAGQCLGWRATRIGDHVYHGHGGGIHGFASQVLFSKLHRTGVICLANVWPHGGALSAATDILETVVAADEAAVSQHAAQAGHEDRPNIPTPAHLKLLLGTYFAPPGIYASIEFRDGQLRLEKSPFSEYMLHAPAVLEAIGDQNSFIVRGGRGAGERVTFSNSKDGQPASFELGGFVYRRFERNRQQPRTT